MACLTINTVKVNSVAMSSVFAHHLWHASAPSSEQIFPTVFGIACMQTVLSVLSAVEHRLKVAGTYISASPRKFSLLYEWSNGVMGPNRFNLSCSWPEGVDEEERS